MPTDISIVVPVHNGAAYLAACLRGAQELRPAPLECIVVDDGSTDGSAQIAREAGALVVSSPGRRGPAYARNLGARTACGEIVLFVDADVVVAPDALERIAERFAEDRGRDAVIGSYDQAPASLDLVSQYRNLLHCYTHQHGQAQTCGFWTGCGAIRRAVFLAYGGFDEAHKRPCIEDVALGARLRQAGKQIWLDKGLQVKHLKRLSFWNVIKTDIMDRAFPWTLLILQQGEMPADLNLKWGQRFSVLGTGWAALAPALAVGLGVMGQAQLAGAAVLSAGIAVAAVAFLNRDFYRFLARARSAWFAARAFPLHCLYFLCAGTGFVSGIAAHAYSRLLGKSSAAGSASGKQLRADAPAAPLEPGAARLPAPSCSAVPPDAG